MHVSKDVHGCLVIGTLRLVHGKIEYGDETPTGREDLICSGLRVRQGDRVVRNGDWLGRDLPDRVSECGDRHGVAVQDVRCAQGLDELLIMRRGGGDDGGKA